MRYCNCCDVTFVYCLNLWKLPDHFSYDLETRLVLTQKSCKLTSSILHSSSCNSHKIVCNNLHPWLSGAYASGKPLRKIAAYTTITKWCSKLSHSSERPLSASWDYLKKQWAGTLLSVKCCCFMQKLLIISYTTTLVTISLSVLSLALPLEFLCEK